MAATEAPRLTGRTDPRDVKSRIDLLSLIGQDTSLKKVASTRGGEWAGACPFCGGEDRFHVQPFLEDGGRWWCRHCSESKEWEDAFAYVMRRDRLTFPEAVAQLRGEPVTPARPAAPPTPRARKRPQDDPEDAYPYYDAEGQILAYHYRYREAGTDAHGKPNKRFTWVTADGYVSAGDVKTSAMPPYNLPALLARPDARVWVVEGEKAADAAAEGGLCAVSVPGGAGQRDFSAFAPHLRGRRVVLWADSDGPGRELMRHLAAALTPVTASVQVVDVPGLPDAGDAADYFAAGRATAELELLVAEAEEAGRAPAVTLAQVLAIFKKWLHLPDTGVVEAVLGTVVANVLPGDPAWLMLVGGPGWGKTEVLQPLRGLPYAHVAATVTEPALLSGTSKKEKAAEAKGGLLREIGDFGLLVLKDFTSILSMHRDQRGAVLAALREIYDGSWTRHVGVDGGRSLAWQGKLGIVAGCTGTIDSHHAVIGSMGERFVFYRLKAEDDDALALKAVAHVGQEASMRRELTDAVTGLFAGLTIPDAMPKIDQAVQQRIIDLAVLVSRCRSAVERDSHTRDIELIPEHEAPSRLALVLTRVFVGMRILGLDDARAWAVLKRMGMDSMPALRRLVFERLAGRALALTTTDVATAVSYPTQTTRRALEDLAAHGVVERIPGGEGKADQWELTPFSAGLYVKVEGAFPKCQPPDGSPDSPLNTSDTTLDDFSGKVGDLDLVATP